MASGNAEDNEESQTNQLDESAVNQSLIESKIMKQVKQHLNSEKYLTEREKKLRLRRKHAEEIIAWKKKLDDEELQVREIEKKANLVLHLKTPAVGKVAVATGRSAKDEGDGEVKGVGAARKTEHSYSESFVATNVDKTETIKTAVKTR